MRGTENRRPPASRKLAATGAALTLALFLGVSDQAGAAWDGKQDVKLGDSMSAELTGEALEQPHQFTFFAPAKTSMKVTAKKAAGLDLEYSLVDIAGMDVPLGATLDGAKDKINKFVFATSGWYTLRVGAAAGSGRYTLKTVGKYPTKFTVTADMLVQDLGEDFDGEAGFEAVAGATFNATVKPVKKSAATAVVEALQGPLGPVGIMGADTAKLKNEFLPFGGAYDLWLRNSTTGGAGQVTAKITVKLPGKKSYSFDKVEDTTGLVAQQRTDWMGSGHADQTAEAFRHWDADGAISAGCATCHSTPGFQDYIGLDGTPNLMDQDSEGLFPNVADSDAALGTTVHCDACHNSGTETLTEVVLPSGAHITDLGAEARCMTCHQGRESGLSLQAHIDSKNPVDDDTQAGFSFQNIHYFAAGATLYGAVGNGAYQYEGKFYDGLSPHVDDYNTCIECHNPHTLEVRFDECAVCHPGVTDGITARDTIRMARSIRDYDGDGDVTEGIFGELDTMANVLYLYMRAYATGVAGSSIGYNPDAYPYWFVDDNDNGTIDEGESTRYGSWTARLLRAAYNYQYFKKDPGTFAHNRKYMIEILYDTIENIGEHPMIDVPLLSVMSRNDSGHFDATGEAYRHWDRDADDIEPGSIDRGDVSSSCARCHSPDGFDFYAVYGIDITISTEVSDGLKCETCHTDFDSDPADPPRKFIAEVTFPSGVSFDNDEGDPDDSFICMTCHQGRQAMADVQERIDNNTHSFRNIHYFPSGATIYGGDADVGFEYKAADQYAGKWDHNGGGNGAKCAYCHLEDHSFEPMWNQQFCGGCHGEANSLDTIRKNRDVNYNGIGGTTDTLEEEVATFGNGVLTAMQAYANANNLDPIGYDSHTYPYFLTDTNNNGVIDGAEADRSNGYSDWDDALLKASFNYQFWQKEPGAWAHNTEYMIQILYDAIEDLNGDVSNFIRP